MAVVGDLASYHEKISGLFKIPKTTEEWDQYRLTDEQITNFHEYGYLSGIKMLDNEQVEVLRKELDQLLDPTHPGHHLFYEFHSNESEDQNSVLFHSLGHWRITPVFAKKQKYK